MSRFKKGDKVRVVPFNKENYLKKKDLKAMSDEYADVWALAAGNVYKVAYWRTLFGINQYELEGVEDWMFDEWMLEPAGEAETIKPKFKVGDFVRVRDFKRRRSSKNNGTIVEDYAGRLTSVIHVNSDGTYKLHHCNFGLDFPESALLPAVPTPAADVPDDNVGENVNRCVSCGAEIPEGRMVCPACENGQEPHIKDSGERTEYASGAVRDCKEGKGRFDLMPLDVVAEMYPGSEFLHLVSAAKQRGSGCLVDALCNLAEEVNWGCGENEVIPTNRRKSAMLLEIAKHFEEGAKKYGENNWQKGIPVHSYIDSAVRHYIKHMAGWRDEPHDRAAAWNIMCCVWTMWHHPELDDWTEKVVAVDGSK